MINVSIDFLRLQYTFRIYQLCFYQVKEQLPSNPYKMKNKLSKSKVRSVIYFECIALS